MDSPASSSSSPERSTSSAFDLLHERVRRWVYDQGWTALRDVQERAIPAILEGKQDVIISAATAAGKTEAAFLSICSRLVDDAAGGIRAMYIGPLKALINDQFRRLDQLCERLEIPVHRWHGDVDSGRKKAVLKNPRGILLITPESLEALFVLRGAKMLRFLRELDTVVIDELHSFLGTERGRQLQSLLHRVECVVGRRVPRIGLSATLGDEDLAKEYIRPRDVKGVVFLKSESEGQEVRIQVRGYRKVTPSIEVVHVDNGDDRTPSVDVQGEFGGDDTEVAEHLFAALRGKENLIFANARSRVEYFADRLRRLCETRGVPNEFWPHHGSLSKDLRQDVEERLKKRTAPMNVVCTTTLEMGIDIGHLDGIAQIGPPPSVASLRQRTGRSGRKEGTAQTLRAYIQEAEITPQTAIQDTLRARLVQTIAMIQLMLDGWCEPPPSAALNLSTLIQQTLSMVAQHGGVTAQRAWRDLCGDGPFGAIDERQYTTFLRCLGERRLLEQASDGTLLLGEVGERVVEHYSFYAAFATPEEYRLVCGGKTLGSLPIDSPVTVGMGIIFAGRRWRVGSVDVEHRVIVVTPSAGGNPPIFGGGGIEVHDRVRLEMYKAYMSTDIPAYLDAMGRDLLGEGRASFWRLRLTEESMVESGGETLLFLWRGDRVMNTVTIRLQARGLEACHDGLAISVAGMGKQALRGVLADLVREGPGGAVALAATVRNKSVEKWDSFLSEDLLNLNYASRYIDTVGAHDALVEVLGSEP